MAAPTNVRVESNSISSARLDWTYGGAGFIAVYRALHGGSYSEVTDASTRVIPGITTYIDSTVTAGVFYDYKLSDDAGATFSSVVSVVVQSCPSTTGSLQSTTAPGLPQFVAEEDVNATNLQQLSQQVEATLTQKLLSPSNCSACPTNGAVVVDCSDGCTDFQIIASADINSISIVGCNNSQPGTIQLIIPPNVTRKICGWPAGFGFTGDECFNAPIVSGAAGRTITVSRGNAKATATPSSLGYGGMGGGGGGGAGGTCFCEPNKPNKLTIKSCNPNNSLGCSSDKSLDLIACGGELPYTWSKTGSIVLSRATGPQITVRPPTNNGPAVAGNAYLIRHYICVSTTCSGANCTNVQAESEAVYGCNDNFVVCQAVSGGIAPTGTAVGAVCCPETGEERCPSATCPDFGNGVNQVADIRTGPMTAAGCNPCGLAASGATVTVTDAVGTSVTIILTA